MMKQLFILLLCLCMLPCAQAFAETAIVLDGENITVNGEAITSDETAAVYLALKTETHEDVPDALSGVQNRVITIASAGDYRISGSAQNLQILVRAGSEADVRLILDGADIACRTASAIAIESARDPRVPGEYGAVIELYAGSDNRISGSHSPAMEEDGIEYDGAIGSQVSLGFEGSGSLTIDADNEGVEVAYGHLTINGGTFHISACDDPLNVSEDGVGTLTVNDGYLFSSVKPLEGGEGDGIDSNGYIVFNGGTVINLAHPSSGDSGIDSDMGSSINGGIIVGAGNMYDPIDADSRQLFMMLEFAEETDDLVVVTDENDVPVFAYDFPYSYMYVAFSTPQLREGNYRVYLGGEIEGEQQDGLYTSVTSYVPGRRMQHGEGTAQRRGAAPGMGAQPPEMPDVAMDMGGGQMDNVIAYQQALAALDLNELLKDADLGALLDGADLNKLLTGFPVGDLLTQEQIETYFPGIDVSAAESVSMFGRGRGGDFGGGFGGPRSLESSADVATDVFTLAKDSTGFTNVQSVQP